MATSRAALLDAAAELFVEHGYHAVSASDIAARAGYSREMVRTRFGSKLELARELVRVEYQQELLPDLEREMPAIERLRKRCEQLATLARNAPVRIKAAFVLGFESAISVPELEPDFGPWLRAMEDVLTKEIEWAMADGDLIDVDARRLARLVVDASTGAAFAALRSGNPGDAGEAPLLVLELASARG